MVMKDFRLACVVLIVALAAAALPVSSVAGDCAPPRVCAPDPCIPPESVGGIGVPFDLPIWPTIIKTEFHIFPWLSFSKASVCIPGSCKAIEFPAPCLTLKPIPVWFPWLRPLCIENCPPGVSGIP
jgi:hypothetical protein